MLQGGGEASLGFRRDAICARCAAEAWPGPDRTGPGRTPPSTTRGILGLGPHPYFSLH